MSAHTPKSAVEVLIAARNLIASPAAWTKGVMARREDGRGADVKGPEAVCWCALGAIRRCCTTGQEEFEANDRLVDELPSGDYCIAEFNDRKSTSHAVMLSIFDAAIAKAEQS